MIWWVYQEAKKCKKLDDVFIATDDERIAEACRTYGMEYYLRDAYVNTPEVDSPTFKPIYMAVTLQDVVPPEDKRTPSGEKAETGALHYGNADPAAEDYDSLADFCFSDDGVEIRIPWQLLNFSDPSQMLIHDDYYSCYGVENLQIESLTSAWQQTARSRSLFRRCRLRTGATTSPGTSG